MEKFSFSGLWKHVGSTVIAAALMVADPLLSYLNVVSLPAWGHGLVGVLVAALAFYNGSKKPQLPA